MKIVPWILVLLLAGGCYFLYSKTAAKDREIEALQLHVEELEGQVAELEQMGDGSIDFDEVKRLRNEVEEIYKLRGEIAALRRENQQLSTQVQHNQHQMRSARQVDPLFDDFPPPRGEHEEAQFRLQREQAEACVNHLKMLEEAKSQWAIANNKSGGDPATQNDVLPYVPNQAMPLCPSGGTYTFNEVGVPTSCSVEGHSLLP